MQKDIIVGGWIIDICIDKNKIDSYKTEMWKLKYIEKQIKLIFDSLIWKKINWIYIRNMEITPNHYWGAKECIINDIWYSCKNILPLNKNFISYRYFHVDLIWVIDKNLIWTNDINNKFFQNYINDNYIIDICSYKLI